MKAKLLLLPMFLLGSNAQAMDNLYCHAADTFLSLNAKAESARFSYSQYCWNPCHMGSGTLGLESETPEYAIYQIVLDEKARLIEPLHSREMSLFYERATHEAILSDSNGENRLLFVCQER